MHHQHAGLLGLGRVADWVRITSHPDFACGGRFDSRQQLGKGGLPRAVGAADGEYLAGVPLKVDTVERLHTGVVLLDANRLERPTHPAGADGPALQSAALSSQ